MKLRAGEIEIHFKLDGESAVDFERMRQEASAKARKKLSGSDLAKSILLHVILDDRVAHQSV